MKRLFIILALCIAAICLTSVEVSAQRVVPKLGNICPMGYVSVEGHCHHAKTAAHGHAAGHIHRAAHRPAASAAH